MSTISPPDGTAFLGHRFHPLTLADKDMRQDHLRRYPQHVSGDIFATLAAQPASLMRRKAPDAALKGHVIGRTTVGYENGPKFGSVGSAPFAARYRS